jgi:hypothetical protein
MWVLDGCLFVVGMWEEEAFELVGKGEEEGASDGSPFGSGNEVLYLFLQVRSMKISSSAVLS